MTGMLCAAALVLTGCVTTTTPEATGSAAPVPTITITPTPVTRTGDSPLEPIDAYALCKAQTMGFYDGDPALVTFAGFADSVVALREDGAYFVYVEASDGNREPELVNVGTSTCIVAGTLGNPVWTLFGSRVRVSDAELKGMINMPGESP